MGGRTNTMRAMCAVATVMAIMAASARGAELRLRSQCTAAGAVVTLGDVAEISAANPAEASQLAAIELFPAPTSQRRFLRVRELQDLLVLRRVDLVRHHLSGASQVEILTAAASPANETLSTVTSQRVQRRVQEAIANYLKTKTAEARDWTITVQAEETQMRRIAAANAAELTVGGGLAPFVGRQQFELAFNAGGKLQRMSVQAEVTAPLAAVAVVRAVARGAILHEADLELRTGAVAEGDGTLVYSLAEAVGKETLHAFAPGRAVTQEALRAPLCVRRGEPVTVYGRADGILVRTTARAKDDGAEGELISVESLSDRKSFFARVCGPREVEVLARAARAETETLSYQQ